MTGGAFTPRPRERDAPFAVGERPRSWGDLLSDAGAIAGHLPAGRLPAGGETLMVACGDRYAFAAALLAVWHTGRVAALPPNGRPETIDALCAAQGIPLVIHDGGGAGGLDVRALLGTSAGPIPLPSFAASQIVVCVHTSGSTGAHVACPKTAAQILGEAQQLAALFAIGPEARILCTVPPYHIYGLLFSVLLPLMGGAAMLPATPHHAETIVAQGLACQANVLVSVPVHLHGLRGLASGALPRFSRIFSSGAPLPPATAADVTAQAGVAVTEILGSSETGGIAWRASGEGDAWRPMPGVEVAADAEAVMQVRSPFLDAAAASPYRGADRVAMLPDGRFRLLGRADSVLKIAGQRISTLEVQRRLQEIPGVRDAAVLAVTVTGPRQHEMWAVVAGDGLSVPELRQALQRWLEPIAIPRRFRIVDALPREENGKLARARLEALFAPRAPASTPSPAPTDVEQRVTLNVAIRPDDPYFQGHFEGYPILPGVVQLNNLVLQPAQKHWPALDHLRRVMRLKFRRPIRPGDQLAIQLTRTAEKVAFEIHSAGGAVSSGVLVFDARRGRSSFAGPSPSREVRNPSEGSEIDARRRNS